MRHLTYLAVLGCCVIGTAPLELFVGTGVYRRWRRLALALLPGFLLGVAWDLYAVAHHQWSFDGRYLLPARIGGLPIEELLFFLVIPVCAVLTLEAVRIRKPHWAVGDEP